MEENYRQRVVQALNGFFDDVCLGENDERNVEAVSKDSRLTVSLCSPIKSRSAKQLRTMRSQSSEQVNEDYAESQARVIR